MAEQKREEFIAEKENLYGGSMKFMIFCNYMGSDERLLRNPVSGLLYRAGKMIVFEDFEKPYALFGIPMGGMGAPEYVKTLIEIDSGEVAANKRIREREITTFRDSADRAVYKSAASFFDFFPYYVEAVIMKTNQFYLFDTMGVRSPFLLP